jgi:hypothetical protein
VFLTSYISSLILVIESWAQCSACSNGVMSRIVKKEVERFFVENMPVDLLEPWDHIDVYLELCLTAMSDGSL